MGKCQFNEANVYIPTFVDDMLQDIMFIYVYILFIGIVRFSI